MCKSPANETKNQNNKGETKMKDYQEIEKTLGREMTEDEFWAAGWARLNHVAVADIVSAFKNFAGDKQKLREYQNLIG